ncbi:MAG: amidohydrolase [Alphaproteobacteria bacterium]|nr:MAG: amidohydrolase [Alphaproteobacteria bacterium]
MKRFLAFFSVFFFFLAPTFADEDERIAFVNVNVITMGGDMILEHALVVVEGGRIVSVEENTQVKLPENVMAINGTGKYLIPGLTEMHGHIPRATRIDRDLKDLLFLYVSQGVTTVRGMLGNAGQFKLRDKINAGEVLGPTLYLGGPSFNGNSVSSPNQARRMVRDQVAAGWDFLKIHPGMSRAEYDAMADEATRLGITWGGHVPADVGLERALEAGQVTIDHLDGYEFFTGGEERDRAVQMTLESGAAVVPTNHLWATLLGLPTRADLEAMAELKYISPEARAQNRRRYRGQRSGNALTQARLDVENREITLKALADAGATILLGSDAPQLYSVPGFSIHREMQAMAEAGLSPEQILTSGTSAVGEFFADKDTFGKIAPGQRADMILLEGNPLEDISNMRSIVGVMVRGVWLSREEIDEKLAEIEARNAGWDRF